MAAGELYAFGWIGSALLSAVVASSKNRNSCAWCAMGAIAGPFALLASVLMPARPAASPEEQPAPTSSSEAAESGDGPD